MIDIKTMDRPDQIHLLMELERALGWYPIVSLDVEDLRERFVDEGADVPSDDILHQACKYVHRKNNEENGHLYEWAQDVASELMTKEQTA
jgi:hypothetical protein